MSDIRRTYLSVAQSAVDLVGGREVGDRWQEPSALPEMSLGSLVAHLSRAVLQVGWYLDMPEPEPPLATAAEYYHLLVSPGDRASELNVGVRQRADETAAAGWARLFLDVRSALDRLEVRLEETPAERRLLVFGGLVMLVDEYLKTRIVEMAVHIDDLARSLGTDPPALPVAATTQAIAVLVGAARLRHGDAAVLRALTRRELDTVEALRVL